MNTDSIVIDSSSTENVSSTDERLKDISHNEESPTKPSQYKKWTREYRYTFYSFILNIFFNTLINYDAGSVPVMLNWIQESFKFTSTELGVMGSLNYVSTVIFSAFWSYVFSNYSSKKSLNVSFLAIEVSLVLFGLAINKYMFFVAKFCKGYGQSGYALYFPVWVDTFAPPKHRNLWMAIIQSGLSVGGAVGYIVTSLFSYAGKYGWRYSVMTQALSIGITLVLFWMIPKQFIEFDPSRDDIVNLDLCACEKTANNQSSSLETKYAADETNLDDESYYRNNFNVKRSHSLDVVVTPVHPPTQQKDISRVYSYFDSSIINSENPKCNKCFVSNPKQNRGSAKTKNMSAFRKYVFLLKSSIFMLSALAMALVYFVIYGAQFWMTKIVVSHFKIEERKVFLIFSYVFMTGQITGLVCGSYLTDKIVYHYPNKPLYIDYVVIAWTSIVCLASIAMISYKRIMVLFIGNLVVFFYYVPITPVVLLRLIQSVEYALKPYATSIVMISFNLIGFIGGTLLPGIAVDAYKSDLAAVYTIYTPSFITLVLFITACIIKRSRA